MNTDINLKDNIIEVFQEGEKILRCTKEELIQLIIDVKDIAEDIHADLKANNINDQDFAKDNYKSFSKYRKKNLGFSLPLKKSEELQIKQRQEENDIVAFAIGKKIMREKRLEYFYEYYFSKLTLKYQVQISEDKTRCVIETEEFGIIDYYPKSDKLLIRKDNKWLLIGIAFIENKLL